MCVPKGKKVPGISEARSLQRLPVIRSVEYPLAPLGARLTQTRARPISTYAKSARFLRASGHGDSRAAGPVEKMPC